MANIIQTRTPPGYTTGLVIAAGDTPLALRRSAHFITNGTNDLTQINGALEQAYITAGLTTTNVRTGASGEGVPVTVTNAGGHVTLLPGTYQPSSAISMTNYPYQMRLSGSGPSTIIVQPSGDHAITAIYPRSSEGDALQLDNFRIEGNSAGYHGIFTANCHRMRFNNLHVFRVGLDGLATLASDLNIYEDDSDLISPWSWVASASGTGEYYLVYFASLNSGKGIDWRAGEPASASLDGGGNQAKSGTLGALSAGNWQYGDNDSIGYNTIYVRLSDDSKPDSGDVVINDYSPGSNNHVSDCAFQWAGRMGNRWIGNHETLITNCHYEGNAHGGLYHERTFNFKISNCSIEDTLNSKPGYKSLAVNDSHVTGTVIEDAAEINSVNSSFEQFAGVSITGGCTITSPFPASTNGGNYSFTSTRITTSPLTTSTGSDVATITLSGCPSIKLGDIVAQRFMATACRFTLQGDDKSLTITEKNDNTGGFNVAACYFEGVTSHKTYTLTTTTDADHNFSVSGGEIYNMALTIDGNALDDNAVLFSGVSIRGTTLTIDDVDFVALSGCTLHDAGDITISNINAGIALSANVLEVGRTITLSGAANAAAVGNSGDGTIVATSISGTKAESTNPGCTMTGWV